MNLAEIIDAYVSHQRSLGMRFDSSAKILRSFQRAVGAIEADRIEEQSGAEIS